MFSCDFCEILKNVCFTEHQMTTASALLAGDSKLLNHKSLEAVGQMCSVKKVLLEISQIAHENTCARASFLIKLQV